MGWLLLNSPFILIKLFSKRKCKHKNLFTKAIKEENKCVPPPPRMIFGSKLEVRQCNGDESSDNKEDDKDNKENAVDCVNPVAPNTGKDVVQLNVYGTERQKSSHSHLRNCFPVPGKWRNFPGVFCGTARSLEFTFAVFTSNTSQNEQRKCHQGPDEHNDTNSAKWQCCCCTISNSNCVQEAECQEERSTEEASCQQQIPHLKRSI